MADKAAPAEGTVKIGAYSIRYLDVRACEPQSALAKIRSVFGDDLEKRELRGVVIAAPELPFEIALTLPARSLFLLVSERAEPIDSVLERYHEHLKVIAMASGIQLDTTNKTDSFTSATAAQNTNVRAESPYAQKPAYFNDAAYQDWMNCLTSPWREGDG